MYSFIAYYTCMDDGRQIAKPIEFDGQFFANEKECWMYAVGKACDLCAENESFDIIELVAC